MPRRFLLGRIVDIGWPDTLDKNIGILVGVENTWHGVVSGRKFDGSPGHRPRQRQRLPLPAEHRRESQHTGSVSERRL